jgi:3-phenylpropionate/trans-cinnamate dioxygenase ferredoxin reductase subunit
VVIAADAVNKPGEFMMARRLVGGAIRPDIGHLADINVPLKSLIAA